MRPAPSSFMRADTAARPRPATGDGHRHRRRDGQRCVPRTSRDWRSRKRDLARHGRRPRSQVRGRAGATECDRRSTTSRSVASKIDYAVKRALPALARPAPLLARSARPCALPSARRSPTGTVAGRRRTADRPEPRLSSGGSARPACPAPSPGRVRRCGSHRRDWRLRARSTRPCGESASASLPRRRPARR